MKEDLIGSIKFEGFWAWLFLFLMIDLFLLGIYLIKLLVFGQ